MSRPRSGGLFRTKLADRFVEMSWRMRWSPWDSVNLTARSRKYGTASGFDWWNSTVFFPPAQPTSDPDAAMPATEASNVRLVRVVEDREERSRGVVVMRFSSSPSTVEGI